MSVAARIEEGEGRTAAAFARLAGEAGKDVIVEQIGGGTAVYGGPKQPFNKVAGLGFAPMTAEDFDRLERLHDERRADIRVELSSLAGHGVSAELTRRGFQLIGYENVLGLALTPPLVDAFQRDCDAAASRGIAIARARADETRAWIEAAADGFLTPDTFDGPPPTESFERATVTDALGDATRADGCTLYFARRDGAIAGTGSLRIDAGLAQLAGASTLPPHRRRGVQSALMRARLVDAARRGCDLAVVTTEPASKSQENVQRAGFALLYVRAVLVRARTLTSPDRHSADRAS